MSMKAMNDIRISIHALLAESDAPDPAALVQAPKFLSTLSLRRATHPGQPVRGLPSNFYPRSPCGERRLCPICQWRRSLISIHALLAESDPKNPMIRIDKIPFLSTLSLRRATKSDTATAFPLSFLSTLSLRRATRVLDGSKSSMQISIHALLAESDRRGAIPVILII